MRSGRSRGVYDITRAQVAAVIERGLGCDASVRESSVMRVYPGTGLAVYHAALARDEASGGVLRDACAGTKLRREVTSLLDLQEDRQVSWSPRVRRGGRTCGRGYGCRWRAARETTQPARAPRGDPSTAPRFLGYLAW